MDLKMLPEYLFTVGHSMQEISRDEFSILNGGEIIANVTDKDMCPTLIYRIQDSSTLNSTTTNLAKQLSNEDNNYTGVKLEDINPIDFFPCHNSTWQQNSLNAGHDLGHNRMFTDNRFVHNNSKLLLQGSDDPLISHGANNVLSHDDELPADFAKGLMTPGNRQCNQERLLSNQQPAPQRIVKSGCSNLTKQQLKVKANLMSARNQQMQQTQINSSLSNNTTTSIVSNQKHQRSQKTKSKKGTTVKLRFHHQALPPEYLSHYEATQSQQRMCKNQLKPSTSNQRSTTKSTCNSPKQSQPRNSHENVRSWLQKIAEIQRTANASRGNGNQRENPPQKHHTNLDKSNEQQISENCIATDAHHSKNPHSTQNTCRLTQPATHQSNVVRDTYDHPNLKESHYCDLPYMGEITLDNCKPRRGRKPKKADICHLIYKNYGTILPKKNKIENQNNYSSIILNMESNGKKNQGCEQPLNLCLRDQLNDSYSISSGDELSDTNSSCPTPISTPLDYVRDSMLANNLKNSLNNINTDENPRKSLENPSTSADDDNIMQPITIYYQKLLESGVLLHNGSGPFKTIQKDNQLALKIPIPSGLFPPQKSISSPGTSTLEYPEQLSTPSSAKSEHFLATPTINSTANQQTTAPQKRKRSAIFIPPMNVESTTNSATEVSICKFKFTGGSKPTLQEKKMVSVDAGGNYRYFSGTGDKSSRGFEYFPRESLQHTAGLLPGINCTGQKLSIDIPSPSSNGLNNDLLQMPEPQTSHVVLSGRSIRDISIRNSSVSPKTEATSYEVSKNKACTNFIMDNSSYPTSSPISLTAGRYAVQRRKNDVLQQLRKSSKKEKLEKTFKEQGFLIQTQQFESAEGATYCKFRQLKKITRYLFRNWKSYLPDNLNEDINTSPMI